MQGADYMKFYVGVTDKDWFNYLSLIKPDEVNFWKPGGGNFRAIDSGDLFLFKLKYPENFIVGGGYFFKNINLPLSFAWKAFEQGNGFKTYSGFVREFHNQSGIDYLKEAEPTIGCNIILAPFFFEERDWIPAPKDWKPNIVHGKTYDTETGIGSQIYDDVKDRLIKYNYNYHDLSTSPLLKLGQGSFRIMVTEAYESRCAISGESALPVLDATHIKPYSQYGPNILNNGILLRSDLSRLYEHGYLTISNDYRVKISHRLKEDYGDNSNYANLHGKDLLVLPGKFNDRPLAEYIAWHNENVFLG